MAEILADVQLRGDAAVLDYTRRFDHFQAGSAAALEFPGSALIISHDRWFLDRIATHILAFEDESKVVFFNGNYQEYEADKKRRLGEEGARPHRIRYKALKT